MIDWFGGYSISKFPRKCWVALYKNRPFKGGPKNGRKMNLMLSTHKFDAKGNKPVNIHAK